MIVAAVAMAIAAAWLIERAGTEFVASLSHPTVTVSDSPKLEAKSMAPSTSPIPLHVNPREILEIQFTDGNGEFLSLADFRGRVVLLNIWATWCAPCRKEMPTLDRLQSRLGGRDFEVVALSIDRAGVEVVEKFYEEIKIDNLAIYIDSTGKAARALKIVGLPTTLLIDAEGRELGRLVGPAEWDTAEMVSFLRERIAATRNVEASAVQHPAKKQK